MSGCQKNIQLFTLAWSEETLKQTDPYIGILDNSANLRPDWREYWPIRQYLLNTKLNSNSYYGFFSPKFSLKTGLSGADVIAYINNNPGADVYTFSPQADMGAFFLNVFEQGELFDPGFLDAFQDFIKKIGIQKKLDDLIMDSRQVVFSNFMVAKPSFWRSWLEICEKLFAIAEVENNVLTQKINAATTYPGAVSRKVFMMERIASLLLTLEEWRCIPYSTFHCAWSALPTSQFKHEAVLSDALKIAYNDTKNQVFLEAFGQVRDKVFNK